MAKATHKRNNVIGSLTGWKGDSMIITVESTAEADRQTDRALKLLRAYT